MTLQFPQQLGRKGESSLQVVLGKALFIASLYSGVGEDGNVDAMG